MKRKQICITDKENRVKLIHMFLTHLHWHPLIDFPDSIPDAAILDMKINWEAHVREMHVLCKNLNESWAWEYLWKNWYQPDRWILWARAVCNEIPICNSNAIVESVWSRFKKGYLRRYSRPRLEYMIQILMSMYLMNRRDLVRAHRSLEQVSNR